jgi:hypothetical protein
MDVFSMRQSDGIACKGSMQKLRIWISELRFAMEWAGLTCAGCAARRIPNKRRETTAEQQFK